jgi:retron-type reverse transcriptase
MDATKTKPFNIDKKLVYDAYKAVKANAGAAGVDGQSLEMFDKDLMRNLYKIWNRMSSGSYFPPPVRAVPIPKKTGGQRILGAHSGRSCGADGGQEDRGKRSRAYLPAGFLWVSAE